MEEDKRVATREFDALAREKLKSAALAERVAVLESEKLELEYIDPAANYIFFRCDTELYRPLLERGILIRACDNYRGIPAEHYYRIAIKKRAENEALVAAIKEIIEEAPCLSW